MIIIPTSIIKNLAYIKSLLVWDANLGLLGDLDRYQELLPPSWMVNYTIISTKIKLTNYYIGKYNGVKLELGNKTQFTLRM